MARISKFSLYQPIRIFPVVVKFEIQFDEYELNLSQQILVEYKILNYKERFNSWCNIFKISYPPIRTLDEVKIEFDLNRKLDLHAELQFLVKINGKKMFSKIFIG
jgi:hypothetical protein